MAPSSSACAATPAAGRARRTRTGVIATATGAADAVGGDRFAVVLRAPRARGRGRRGSDVGPPRGVPKRARRAVQDHPRGRGRRHARPPGRAGARPPVAAARACPGGAGWPPLHGGLVRAGRDPRALSRRPGHARIARRRIARGADALAAPRVHAPRARREQPAPPAAIQRPELQPLLALGVALRGRRRALLGPGTPPTRGDRTTAARGRPAGLPPGATGRHPPGWNRARATGERGRTAGLRRAREAARPPRGRACAGERLRTAARGGRARLA